MEHKVKISEVRIKIKSYGQAFAALSYSAYPTIKVFINNKETEFLETLYGMIVVKLNSGMNEIVIMPTRSKLAKVFFYMPLSLFILIFIYIIYYLYKSKRVKRISI